MSRQAKAVAFQYEYHGQFVLSLGSSQILIEVEFTAVFVKYEQDVKHFESALFIKFG